MRAGYGIADITPPLGVELAGYGYYLERRAARVLDPLFARALYIDTADARWLLLCCDLLGLSQPVVEAVLAGLRARHGLLRSQVMIVSIHTHTGPAVKHHEGCGEVDDAYVRGLPDTLLRAAAAAIEDARAVCTLRWREGRLPVPFAYNRAASEGPVDDTVRGFVLERASDIPIALVSYACHPVTWGRVDAVSADYPGRVCALLEAKGYRALYLNGLCGDIDPIMPQGVDRESRLAAFAQAICEAFEASDAPLPLTARTGRLPFALRLTATTPEDIRITAQEAILRGGGPNTGAGRVAAAWADTLLSLPAPLPEEETIGIAFARLGGVWLLAFPFEGFTQTGLLLRQALAGAPLLALGCAEELLGYLPTRDDIARGSYAALESSFLYKRLPAASGEAERLGEAAGYALLKEEVSHARD